MKHVLTFALLAGLGWTQNTVVFVPPTGGVIPPPDIVKAAGDIAEAPAKAQAQAMQIELENEKAAMMRQQTELLRQQTEALKAEETAKPTSPTAPAALKLYRDGNGFLEECEDGSEAFFQAACAGYVSGVADGMIAGAAMQNKSTSFCRRPGVSWGQQRRVVLAYIKAHPDNSDMPTALLVDLALTKAFPCAVLAPSPR
jgi:hypothetical protein